MKSLTIVTSALNTKFGVFTNDERLHQTLQSIESVRRYNPNSDIALLEMGGIPPTHEQLKVLQDKTDFLFNFSNDERVKSIFNENSNWDVVKNVTETLCFGCALNILNQNSLFDRYNRFYKLSGRYVLNQFFDIKSHESAINSFVFLCRKPSQFSPEITGGIMQQFMSRFYSWPPSLFHETQKIYEHGLRDMIESLNNSRYIDIEHMLYKYANVENSVNEIPVIGVSGLLGPNGAVVSE